MDSIHSGSDFHLLVICCFQTTPAAVACSFLYYTIRKAILFLQILMITKTCRFVLTEWRMFYKVYISYFISYGA